MAVLSCALYLPCVSLVTVRSVFCVPYQWQCPPRVCSVPVTCLRVIISSSILDQCVPRVWLRIGVFVRPLYAARARPRLPSALI